MLHQANQASLYLGILFLQQFDNLGPCISHLNTGTLVDDVLAFG